MHALLLAAAIALPGFQEAKTLEPAASFVAKKPVVVWCAKSDASWKAFLQAHYGAANDSNGSATPGSTAMHLSGDACNALLFTVKAPLDPLYYPTLGPSVETLVHEAIHLRGETDEGVTDCNAMHETPGVAVRFFHVTAGKRLRALMDATWKWHRLNPGDIYQSVC